VTGAIFVILTIASVGLMIPFITWRVHLSQTRDFTEHYGWGNYRAFRHEFECRDWDNENWRCSFFESDTDSKVHAGIVKFDGKGMLLPFFDWLRVMLYLRGARTSVASANKETVKW
jgi:hypothetical protein